MIVLPNHVHDPPKAGVCRTGVALDSTGQPTTSDSDPTLHALQRVVHRYSKKGFGLKYFGDHVLKNAHEGAFWRVARNFAFIWRESPRDAWRAAEGRKHSSTRTTDEVKLICRYLLDHRLTGQFT